MAGQAEQPRAGRVGRTGGGECRAAFADDVEHVDQRLDVVDEGRLSEQAHLYREGRLVPWLSPLPLDRVEERGLLATDVGARASAHLDVESNARARDVVPKIAVLAGETQGVFDSVARQRIFGADVQVTAVAARRDRGDGHRLDDG